LPLRGGPLSTKRPSTAEANHGWDSLFPVFRDAQPRIIRTQLGRFIVDASREQLRAWDDSIPLLQNEVRELCDADPAACECTAILEYELPLESRRPDVVLLVRGAIVVLELKGKESPSQADLDQAAAYARDLRCYHRACDGKPVHAVVVPTRATGRRGVSDGVHVVGPDALDSLVQDLQPDWQAPPLTADEFLAADAYRPLPTLVQAARELFQSGAIRRVWRAAADTDPTVDEITRIVHEAAATKTRRLVLVTGVPGAGKTLVGLRAVHANFLADLAVDRANGKPTVPAVFLSGNAPLVQVLQYELKKAGGGGKTFVRGVKDYVKAYSRKNHLVPPEHVLVFDEAQRAWDEARVAYKHPTVSAKSEPEHFIEFAERIPGWCVVIGLIGTGQEIHEGEEGGLVQWRRAVERPESRGKWTVHGPARALEVFGGTVERVEASPRLSLDKEIRFHLAKRLHEYVDGLLQSPGRPEVLRPIADQLVEGGYRILLTRDVDTAKAYLRDRYSDAPEARHGLLASSKDRDLADLGIPNDWNGTKLMNRAPGPWFCEGGEHPRSCRRLAEVATEFQAQGLELDAALLAWGTDLVRTDGVWSNANARGYKRGAKVRDPFQLRVNAYRVLLTRARDVCVLYVPPLGALDETHAYLRACGARDLVAV
jgi:hypothetical protein